MKQETVDVIIFSGQSNMQGQTECLTDETEVEGAWEYHYLSDALVPLKNPVGENIRYDKKQGEAVTPDTDQAGWLNAHVLGGACYGHTNMVPAFCRSYLEITGRNMVAVHAAKGSTEITDWLPGTAGYDMLVEKSTAAICKTRELYETGHIFFVWLQGESDAIAARSGEDYKEKMILLGESLKQSVGIEKFCVIRVGRFTQDDRDLEIINAQDEVCQEHPDFLMLTRIATELNEQPEYMNPYVGGHYSAKGLERLGEESGKTLGEN